MSQGPDPKDNFDFWVDFFFGAVFGAVVGLLFSLRLLSHGHLIPAVFIIAGFSLLLGAAAGYTKGGVWEQLRDLLPWWKK